jgi:hypothetical protein
MKFLNNLFKKPVLLVIACVSANFIVTATVVTTTTPTSAQVEVANYSYDGTTFSGQIYVSSHASLNINGFLIYNRLKILRTLK